VHLGFPPEDLAGGAKYVYYLANELAMLGNKVAVFTNRPSTIKKEIVIDYRRPRISEDENLSKYQQQILAELRPEVKASE